jgi:hypothetical protein
MLSVLLGHVLCGFQQEAEQARCYQVLVLESSPGHYGLCSYIPNGYQSHLHHNGLPVMHDLVGQIEVALLDQLHRHLLLGLQILKEELQMSAYSAMAHWTGFQHAVYKSQVLAAARTGPSGHSPSWPHAGKLPVQWSMLRCSHQMEGSEQKRSRLSIRRTR